jgi:hypothetical protein
MFKYKTYRKFLHSNSRFLKSAIRNKHRVLNHIVNDIEGLEYKRDFGKAYDDKRLNQLQLEARVLKTELSNFEVRHRFVKLLINNHILRGEGMEYYKEYLETPMDNFSHKFKGYINSDYDNRSRLWKRKRYIPNIKFIRDCKISNIEFKENETYEVFNNDFIIVNVAHEAITIDIDKLFSHNAITIV